MSGPGQGASRTSGRLLIAWVLVALPASLAAAPSPESAAPLACALSAAPPAPAASPAFPPSPAFPVFPAPPASWSPPAPGASWTATGALVPDEPPPPNAERGFAVATGREPTSGAQLAVIGARFDGPFGGGAVYLFVRTGLAWEEMLHCWSTQAGEQFGISVALHGDTLVVGAPGQLRDQERPEGVFYVLELMFAPNGPTRRATPRIVRTERIAGLPAGVESKGRAVALDDNWLAVSATMPGAGGVLGAVLVYPLPFMSGSAPAVLMPAVPQPGDRFGESLALSHGTLISGAPGRSGIAGQAAAGAVYLFPLAGGGQPVGELRPLQEAADAQFGSSVSASGSSLAVSAVGAGGHGAVYVFALANDSWTQQAALVSDLAHAAVDERFGQAVAIDDDLGLLAAGEPLSSAGAPYGGAALLFQRYDDAWNAVPGTIEAGAEQHALFGSAVALLDGFLLVGAPLANQGKGAVCAYDNFGPAAGAARP